MQRAADGEDLKASSEELGVLVAVRWCGVEVARLGVVLRSSTPEPTAAPTSAVESEGVMRQCRRGLAAQSLPRIDQDESKEPWFVNANTKSATKERLPRGWHVNSLGQSETRCGRARTSLSHPQNATNTTSVSVQVRRAPNDLTRQPE